MANEFRIKHGLIVTGSSYFSESMFAPNLPEETSPSYYITWRDTDGRFEVSTVTPGAQANTVGCWDYATGDPLAGDWTTTPSTTVGNTTTAISINNEDNGGNNQYSLLNGLGIGSVITLYVGANSTSFSITGIQKPSSTSGGANGTWTFNVSYLSGNEYTPSTGAEMCLAVAAAAAGNSAGYCIDYQMASSWTYAAFNDGFGGFDRVVGGVHYTPPFGTVDTNIESLFLNNDALNNTDGITFFNGFVVGDFLSISYQNKTTHFQVTHLGGLGTATPNILINVIYNGGDTGYTIPTNDTFTICKSPGL
jgi:hypothetical protein